MGQFGVHASVGLLIAAYIIPKYNTIARYSFIVGNEFYIRSKTRNILGVCVS